jgi:hypothetical protein
MIARTSIMLLVLTLVGCVEAKHEAEPTAQPLQIQQTTAPKQLTGKLRYSFVDRYPNGTINSQAVVQTPTGRGALILSWPFYPGQAKSLTVVSGFKYSYPDVAIGPADMLTFEVAKPLTMGGDVMASIDVTDNGRATRVFVKQIPPATTAVPTWQPYAISMKPFAGHRVTITFGLDAKDSSGAWVAFANPAVFEVKE